MRLVVEREREIRAFVPDEYWSINANFTAELAKASSLSEQWAKLLELISEHLGPDKLELRSWIATVTGFHLRQGANRHDQKPVI